ncbi:ATP-dependent DNA helicase Pif1 [Rhizophagus clarus]|uniref:ATP-dependent DNA helicase Pif1 n=1 Tax=Rhizophagus clarus TaxID=94130 RepID=A0A8H3LIG4_9GLOM|nr:ATP-dependent DNA helicase Pif1 [Rhizophagus clarus]
MYLLCYKHNLIHLWGYLWTHWYQNDVWLLWARSASPDEICIFKTTMLTESHWKVIKRDYLPKFFCPRLDLVTYIMINRLIPHNEMMLKKYLTGRQDPSWRKDFKHNWKQLSKKESLQTSDYLTDSERWICSCPYFLTNRFFICKYLVNNVKENISSRFFKEVQRQGVYPLLEMKANFYNNVQEIPSTEIFVEIENTLKRALQIVQGQHALSNIQWAKSINKNIEGVRKMVCDIDKYENRITNPKTWKEHNKNTIFYE